MKILKDVLISIKGTQNDGEESNVIEMVTEGKMSEKDGKTLLSYSETFSPGEPNVTTYLRIEDKKVVIQRSLPLDSRLLIEKQKRNLCHYKTNHGDITMGVFGETIKNNLKTNGSIYLKYTLDVNSCMLSTNEIELKVKEV